MRTGRIICTVFLCIWAVTSAALPSCDTVRGVALLAALPAFCSIRRRALGPAVITRGSSREMHQGALLHTTVSYMAQLEVLAHVSCAACACDVPGCGSSLSSCMPFVERRRKHGKNVHQVELLYVFEGVRCGVYLQKMRSIPQRQRRRPGLCTCRASRHPWPLGGTNRRSRAPAATDHASNRPPFAQADVVNRMENPGHFQNYSPKRFRCGRGT